MDRKKVFKVIDRLELPKGSYAVVGDSVLLMLPDSWKKKAETLHLVVSPPLMRRFKQEGWAADREGKVTRGRASRIADVNVAAGFGWRASEGDSWYLQEILLDHSLEIDGYIFADPRWLMEQEMGIASEKAKNEKSAYNIKKWGEWSADVDRLNRFIWTYPSDPFKARIDYALREASGLLPLTSGWWEASEGVKVLRLFELKRG